MINVQLLEENEANGYMLAKTLILLIGFSNDQYSRLFRKK